MPQISCLHSRSPREWHRSWCGPRCCRWCLTDKVYVSRDPCRSPLCEYSMCVMWSLSESTVYSMRVTWSLSESTVWVQYRSLWGIQFFVWSFVVCDYLCNSGDDNDDSSKLTWFISVSMYIVWLVTLYVKCWGCILIHAPQVCDRGHCTGAYGHFRASAVACMSWECVPKAGGDWGTFGRSHHGTWEDNCSY